MREDTIAPSALPVSLGELVGGRYRIVREITTGGMGVICAAHDETLGRDVVVKFLKRQECARPNAVKRFMREAQAAARIQSAHVVAVFDVGEMPTGEPFIAMEYLRGADLSHVLESRGRLPLEVTVDYVLQACEAIAEGHSLGIIHRDLKPSNLFIARHSNGSEVVKVLDFGISKLLYDNDAPSITRSEHGLGTPFYMSPEQIRSAKHTGPRSDIWSIGILLHQMLTGSLPFQGTNTHQIFASILCDRPMSLRYVIPEMPSTVEAIILKCLAKDEARRFASLADLAQALAPFGPEAASVSVERIVSILTPQSQSTQSDIFERPVQSDSTTLSEPDLSSKLTASLNQTKPAAPGIPRAFIGALAFAAGLTVAALTFRASPRTEQVIASGAASTLTPPPDSSVTAIPQPSAPAISPDPPSPPVPSSQASQQILKRVAPPNRRAGSPAPVTSSPTSDSRPSHAYDF